MGLEFGKIGPGSTALAALERLKKIHRPIMGEHSGAFIFKWIFIILAGNKDNYKSLNEF